MSQVALKRENPKNKYITKEDVKKILNKYGVNVPVIDIEHFHLAFVHRSYLKTSKYISENTGCEVPLQQKCNEMLETLGDAILGSVVVTYLFDRFKNISEGFITRTKIKLVRGTTLGKLGKKMNLGEWLIISLHVESEKGRSNIRILEDLFECFIGALYLDNGGEPLSKEWYNNLESYYVAGQKLLTLEENLKENLTQETMNNYINQVNKFRELSENIISKRSNGFLICQSFILNVIEKELDLVKLIKIDDNYKDRLQRYFLENFNGLFPKWEVIKITGNVEDRMYTVGVRDDRGVMVGIATEKKKSDAEKMASKEALKLFGEEIEED